MSNTILEDGTPNRRHRQRLSELLAKSDGVVRIATAYVTERQFVSAAPNRELAPAVVNVVVAAESDDRRPPHRRLFAGRVLHQLDERPGVRASGFVGEQIDEPVHA